MDIFICRSRRTEDAEVKDMEENIIFELKSTKKIINKEISRQIEDYMLLISKEPKFNSILRRRKYIMVSNKINDDIRRKYEAFKDKGSFKKVWCL